MWSDIWNVSYIELRISHPFFTGSLEPVKNGCEVIYEMFHILNCGFHIPSRAFFISVHFFPVLGKSATWNDTQPPNFLPWLLHRTSKFSSWVVPLAFKSEANWRNDGKDGQTWTCNFERRFRYRCVVDLKLLNPVYARGPLGCLLGFWLSGPKPCGSITKWQRIINIYFILQAVSLRY